jgi:hypothetical protein
VQFSGSGARAFARDLFQGLFGVRFPHLSARFLSHSRRIPARRTGPVFFPAFLGPCGRLAKPSILSRRSRLTLLTR